MKTLFDAWYVIAFRFLLRQANSDVGLFDNKGNRLGEAELKAELDMIVDRIGFEEFRKNPELSYLTMSRIGSRVPLRRAERRSILSLLENAINHAYYEIGDY